MKRLWFAKSNTKRGVASLYVVIFATMLFGVVTLSFIRIVINEAGQSSDDDLSRSAYDSAMAGVEDAKTAVNQYYDCLRGNGANCDKGVLFQDNCNNGEIGLAKFLYSYSDGEVKIQENGSVDGNTTADQAYTCVIISNTVPDYRGTLTKDTRTKVVPLRIKTATSTGTPAPITKVSIKWYSTLNQGGKDLAAPGVATTYSDKKFRPNNSRTVPPTLSASFIKVEGAMNIDNFHKASNYGNVTYSSLAFIPSDITTGNPSGAVSADKIYKAGNIKSDADGINDHEPISVTCSSTSEFACVADLNVNINPNDTAFLVLSLPYEETISDFAVELSNGSGVVEFEGVQISVDSTGRTSQLVRRVETRLDPADLYFPYPQYEIEATGSSGEEIIKKNFWITNNCWFNQPTHSAGSTCDNNGNVVN